MAKRIIITLFLVICACMVTTTQADVIYHELFAGGADPSPDTLANIGWNHYTRWASGDIYTETGTDEWGNVFGTWATSNISADGGMDVGVGSINSNPLVPDVDADGFIYNGGGYMNNLYYTAEYTININDWTNLIISFNHFHDVGFTEYRAALAITSAPNDFNDLTWYISDPCVTDTGTGWSEPRIVIDTSVSEWYELDINEVEPNMVSPLTLPATGYIVGFGFQHAANNGTQRYDNFMVEGTYQGPPIVLTVAVEPNDVGITNVNPSLGDHGYAPGSVVNISASSQAICPDIWEFDYWIGDVADANAASTTVTVDASKTVTAVYVAVTRVCGDECHPYPDMDFNEDCWVDLKDFAEFAIDWLYCTQPACD